MAQLLLRIAASTLILTTALTFCTAIFAQASEDESEVEELRDSSRPDPGAADDPQAPEDGITGHEGDGQADTLDCADLLAQEDRDAANNQVGGGNAGANPVPPANEDRQDTNECRARQQEEAEQRQPG